MIDEVAKALKAYRTLGTVGKRLFRNEEGLVRPQQAKARKKRTPFQLARAAMPGEPIPVKRAYTTRRAPAVDGNVVEAGGEA